jgi:hypothetical protein
MRWLRISLFTIAGIVAVLLTAIAVLLTLDFGRFKDRIEIAASDFLGRELRIDGELHANIGSRIDVYAEDFYLANPEWAENEAFVTASKVDISIVTWSLMNGPIEFERIEIDGVSVYIEQNESGEASWTFDALAASSDDEIVDEALIEEVTAVQLPVMLDYGSITNTEISYSSPTMKEPLVLAIDSVLSSIDGDNLNVNLTGDLNGKPIHFEKTTGPIENLLGYKDVTVDLVGNIGEIEIRSSSWVGELLSPRRPRLDLEITGPSAEYLTDILAIQQVTTGPLSLSVSVQESSSQMLASVDGVFGEFVFSVDGHFQDIQELQDIHLELSAGGPDIGSVIRLAGGKYDDIDPFAIRGKIVRSGSKVTIEDVLVDIGESHLTLNGLFAEFPTTNGAEVSLIASGPDFGRFNRLMGMPGRLGGAFTTSLTLSPHDDGRTLVELDADAEHVRIQVQSLLSASDNFADSTVQLNISGADISIMMEAAGYAGLPAEAFEIAGSIEKDRSGYRVQQVRALVGDDLIQIDGHIGDKPLAGETDFEISITGSDLGASFVALGGSAENLPKGAYHLTGRVQKQDDKLWLRNIESVIGDDNDYVLKVSGFLTIDQELQDSAITVHAKGASLAALAELARVDGVPDFPFEIRTDIRRGLSNTYFENGLFNSGIVEVEFGGHVGDKPLEDDLEISFKADVPRMKEVIAEFGIAVDQIPEGDLTASGTLLNKSGQMSLAGFDANFEGATLRASGRIGQVPTMDGTRISFEFSGDDLSRILPPDIDAEALHHDFAVEGRVALEDSFLAVDRLSVNLGNTSLGGEARLALDPIVESGSFSLKAGSPDLFELFPGLRDVSVPQTAKMKFTGSGNWSDNYWNFENVDLQLGEGYIRLHGGLDGPPGFNGTDLSIEVHASSVRNMSVLAGRPLPDQALHLTAHFIGTPDVMTMERFELTFGESDLQGDFTMRSGDVPAVKIDARSTLFDISEYFPPAEETEEASPPRDKNAKVIPDTPLPLEMLRSLDADVLIEIDEMRTPSMIQRGVKLDALLSDGALKIENLSLISQRGGEFNLSADLIPKESGGADFALSINGESLVMGFAAKTEEDLQQLPVFSLRAELNANGETIRDLAGSLDGYIRLVGGEGRMKAGSFTMFTRDFISEVVETVNPFTKSDPYTNVECATILLPFDNGVIDGSPALIQKTDKLLIFANSKIDLKTEKLFVDFKMVPQKGLGVSMSSLINPYINITGTLAKPALVLDPESVLIEGGIAVATVGLSVLAKGFKNRFLSDKDPCGTAVKAFDEALELR